MRNIVDLSDLDVIISKGSSSKGNQPKRMFENKWYKTDHMGYEGASEVVVSKLLEKSNIKHYVDYKPVIIKNNGEDRTGCFSENFRKPNTSIITLEHLYRAYFGKSLAERLAEFDSAQEKIRFTVDFVAKNTNLNGVAEYFTQMIELDAFFLNEDRHTNNIAFIYNDDTGVFEFCPYFDFGLSLLSDINDYALNSNIDDCICKVKAKPFDRSFDEQLDAANVLYGDFLKFSFTSSDIDFACNSLTEYYDSSITERTREILFRQKHKYSYMFI